MLPPHLRKFSALYETYGLGAVKNIWLLVCILPIARTVNLYKMKDYVGGVLGNEHSRPASHYKRLIRFFRDWGDRQDLLHDLMSQNLKFLRRRGCKTLIMDGTSWTFGGTKNHYLVLCVLVGPVALPIYWVQLAKIGASNQAERKAMFESACSLYNLKGMTLLADREYIGKSWFNFLKDNNIHFVIRLCLGNYSEYVDASKGKSYEKMYSQCIQKNRVLKKQILLQGYAYKIIMMPNPKIESEERVLIFLTTLTNAPNAAALYFKRWKIECLFRHLKTNGYNLEDLNLKDPNKSLLMMALVSTAYTLAIGEGWNRQKKIATQHYQDGSQTLEASFFREGLAAITQKCFRFLDFLKYVFRKMIIKNHVLFKNVQ